MKHQEKFLLESLVVENFKGFEEAIEINFSKTRSYDFNAEYVSDGVVNKGIIYGKNASGKSNIGYAIFDIVSNLTDKNNGLSLYNNYLNAHSGKDVANFIYTFKYGALKVVYKYSKKSLENILSEELLINDMRVVYYDFTKNDPIKTSLKGTETLDKNFEGMNISVLKYIYKNSKLENNEENKAFQKMIDFVNNMLFFRCLNSNNYIGFQNGSKDILEDIAETGKIKEFEEFLNEEGVKCQLVEKVNNGSKTIAFEIGENKIDFSEIASTGTHSLALFFFWYKSLEKASFLFIDEFDAFYHFELAEKIVQKLKMIDIQVILTTHNTFLMTNELLRPDCYFIVFENKIFKPLFDLTEKELRYGHNLEKIFRAKGFGL